MSKTLYHSALRDMGDVDVTMTCDAPKQSKYKGQPDYMSMKVDGEERNYVVENEACGDALSGYRGKTLTIRADGSKDDATIDILGESENRQERRPATREQQSRREPEQPRNKPKTAEERAADEERAFNRAKGYLARTAVLMQMSLRAASHVAKAELPSATTEDIRALGVTMFIEVKGMTDIHAMPVRVPDPTERRDAPPTKPKVEPPPPPPPPPPAEEEPAEDDIPF